MLRIPFCFPERDDVAIEEVGIGQEAYAVIARDEARELTLEWEPSP